MWTINGRNVQRFRVLGRDFRSLFGAQSLARVVSADAPPASVGVFAFTGTDQSVLVQQWRDGVCTERFVELTPFVPPQEGAEWTEAALTLRLSTDIVPRPSSPALRADVSASVARFGTMLDGKLRAVLPMVELTMFESDPSEGTGVAVTEIRLGKGELYQDPTVRESLDAELTEVVERAAGELLATPDLWTVAATDPLTVECGGACSAANLED